MDSEPGQGSTLIVCLPAVEAEVPRTDGASEAGDRALHGSEMILLVEDNPSVRDLARETLTRYGYRVLEAGNGLQALRIASAHLHDLSLVVTDVVMPVMGGRELASRLKTMRRGLKVLFTSGYTNSTVKQDIPPALFLQKPFTPATLGRRVREMLDAAQPLDAPQLQEAHPRGTRMMTRDPRNGKPGGTILVVDDLETNLELLERMLTAQGYDVRTARDGEEALDLVAQQPPDVVLTDIRMPRRDGFGLCRELKSTASTRLIPVVLMTGASEADDRIQAIEAGATDLLSKPIDLPELKARVRSLVQLKQFTDELDSAEVVLKTLALMIEARDVYTQGHCERLARYATGLGERIGLPEADLVALQKGRLLPRHRQDRDSRFDSPQARPAHTRGIRAHEGTSRSSAKSSVVICARCTTCAPSSGTTTSISTAAGIRITSCGDDVPRLAQIIGIVDVYDAITTDRPYRAALSQAAAFTALRDEVGRGWRDGELVEAFIATQA